tara:strand:+ start:804 stop:1328 length:525 start_codon:yes stop_codon:yes gene_type:complete
MLDEILKIKEFYIRCKYECKNIKNRILKEHEIYERKINSLMQMERTPENHKMIIKMKKDKQSFLTKKLKRQNGTKLRYKLKWFIMLYIKTQFGVSESDPLEIKFKQYLRYILVKRQNNKCAVCNCNLENDITFEHILPRCKGGLTSLRNGKAVHSWCNNYLGVLDYERKLKMLV